VKQNRVTLQIIVSVILSKRISLDSIWLLTCKFLELLLRVDSNSPDNHRNDLFNKVSSTFSEMINHPDPEFRKNADPFHTAFQLAYKTDSSYFGAGGWLTKDPQEAVKFGLA
jgi:hypothetical protein